MYEYTADELAEDFDDEKRLEKAEQATERKARKRKAGGTRPRSRYPAGLTSLAELSQSSQSVKHPSLPSQMSHVSAT